jgi:chromosome partitioning protein
LAFNLSWMFAKRGVRTLAADLDPQSALTSLFLGTEKAAELSTRGETVYRALHSKTLEEIPTCEISDNLSLLAGDVSLFDLEPILTQEWENSLRGDPQAAGTVTSLHQTLQRAARKHSSDLIVMDLAPTIGGINKAALLAASHLIIPIVPDALAVGGLAIAGRVLSQWAKEWNLIQSRIPPSVVDTSLRIPQPLGYVLLKVRVFQSRPIHSMKHWMEAIPIAFYRDILKGRGQAPNSLTSDPNCLAIIKESHLLSMAAEANKPVFQLKPADGALGSYQLAVHQEQKTYMGLADHIAALIGLSISR